jgi:hypothetical protein
MCGLTREGLAIGLDALYDFESPPQAIIFRHESENVSRRDMWSGEASKNKLEAEVRRKSVRKWR